MLNAISSAFARFIEFVTETSANFWRNLDISQYSMFQVALDLLLVSILFYWFIALIRGTRATNIVLGFLGVAVVFALSRVLNLMALGWILDRLLTVILVAIPIIFQQEIRRGLENLGRTKFFLAQEAKEIDHVRNQLIQACFTMAKVRLGALIVLRGEVSLKEYIDTGVAIGARVSKELLSSIFSRTSPLHDGAVIIDQNRIVAAGCVLPHLFKEYGHNFGTRHKAALGLSENTDAHIFVVSEEKGEVAYVTGGHMQSNITEQRMHAILTDILRPKKSFKLSQKISPSHVS